MIPKKFCFSYNLLTYYSIQLWINLAMAWNSDASYCLFVCFLFYQCKAKMPVKLEDLWTKQLYGHKRRNVVQDMRIMFEPRLKEVKVEAIGEHTLGSLFPEKAFPQEDAVWLELFLNNRIWWKWERVDLVYVALMFLVVELTNVAVLNFFYGNSGKTATGLWSVFRRERGCICPIKKWCRARICRQMGGLVIRRNEVTFDKSFIGNTFFETEINYCHKNIILQNSVSLTGTIV